MSIHTPQQLQPEDPNSQETAKKELHIPVLLDQVVELLAPRPGESYLDLTAGYGGHARAIINQLGEHGTATLVDRDENAIRELEHLKQSGVSVVHDDFGHFAESRVAEGKSYDMVLVDFGVSSPQLDRAERGFSIAHNGPLDMRMDRRQQRSALTIVNRATEADLARLIVDYGEERPSQAARIARAIVRSRPHRTTESLALAILSTHRGKRSKIHPATRTFQAIRIAVNDELEQIERLLHVLDRLVASGGRVAFISFHSLEDRLVKHYLKEQVSAGYEAQFEPLTPQAIQGKLHDVHNPRARSAILRAAVKK